jgi:hypothetical protein
MKTKVEFLKAHENGTWDTEIIETPVDPLNPNFRDAVMEWVANELQGQAQYRKVVFWGIYNEEPEEMESDGS